MDINAFSPTEDIMETHKEIPIYQEATQSSNNNEYRTCCDLAEIQKSLNSWISQCFNQSSFESVAPVFPDYEAVDFTSISSDFPSNNSYTSDGTDFGSSLGYNEHKLTSPSSNSFQQQYETHTTTPESSHSKSNQDSGYSSAYIFSKKNNVNTEVKSEENRVYQTVTKAYNDGYSCNPSLYQFTPKAEATDDNKYSPLKLNVSTGSSEDINQNDKPSVSSVEEVSSPLQPSKEKSPSDPAEKPKDSYVDMIAHAILSFPNANILLGDIYKYVSEKYEYFRKLESVAWKNSIRHNLSINDCFIKEGKSHNGRGCYWNIHPACIDDFRKGDFNRRKARAKVQKYLRKQISAAKEMHTMAALYGHGSLLHSNGVNQAMHTKPMQLQPGNQPIMSSTPCRHPYSSASLNNPAHMPDQIYTSPECTTGSSNTIHMKNQAYINNSSPYSRQYVWGSPSNSSQEKFRQFQFPTESFNSINNDSFY